MSRPHPYRPRGFTLVEMLVVLAIVAVLAAMLLPAVMTALNRAKVTRLALEVQQLHDAVNAYQKKHGDYPPGFRNHDAFLRHVMRCYPKIAPAHLTAVETVIWGSPPDYTQAPNIDEGEALVFWLSYVSNDPRQPFKALTQTVPTGAVILPRPDDAENLYSFDETRLVTSDGDNSDGDLFPSYRDSTAKGPCYILIDHRSYIGHTSAGSGTPPLATAEGGKTGETRPYKAEGSAKPFANPTSFQIICAGLDNEFGDDSNVTGTDFAKYFPSGTSYTTADRDNITNFSGGKRLEDSLP